MSRLWQLGRPHLGLLGLAFACMAVLGITTGAYAFLIGPLLRFVLSGGTEGLGPLQRFFPLTAADAGLALPIAIVAIGFVRGLAYLGQFYFVGLYGQKVIVDLRRRLLERFVSLSPLELGRERTGDLLARFTSDVAQVEAAATYTVASWLRDSFQIVVLVAVCFLQSWKLSLIALGALPLAILPAARITRSLFKRLREGQASMGVLASQVHENLLAVRTLQAFNAGPAEVRRFAHTGTALRRTMERAGWTRAAVPALMETLAAVGIAVALGAAAGAQSLQPEALISFVASLILLYQPAKDLGRVSQFAVAAAAALERIEALLGNQKPPFTPTLSSVEGSRGAQSDQKLHSSIKLENVHFSWGGRKALDGLTLELPVGKTTALVGPSGGGKSTVVAALLRFEALENGRVTIDGADTAALPVDAVRRRFALVTQEPLLFSASVFDNLRVGRPEATRDDVERAAKLAQAHDFIAALPQGYDTIVTERGSNFSGGQRQRLCLARALVSDAPVLVLDEATSNLDPESERLVQAALDGALQGRTALVIAHRLSTVAAADRTVVLEGGRVVETGSHAQLLAAQGAYARLWALQQSR
jgi:ATP-binding cassette, subfamily B, bacterial MsbA